MIRTRRKRNPTKNVWLAPDRPKTLLVFVTVTTVKHGAVFQKGAALRTAGLWQLARSCATDPLFHSRSLEAIETLARTLERQDDLPTAV